MMETRERYNDNFDPELQLDLEEAIAKVLFYDLPERIDNEHEEETLVRPSEELANQLGREILGMIVQKLRPDLLAS